MNCDEFRKQIIAEDSDLKALENHIDSCRDCAAWVEKELSTPPLGMSKADWVSATSRCMPTSLPTQETVKSNEETATDPEPISTGFFSGLKYGLVFGLSIITGLAIVQLAQFDPSKVAEKSGRMEIASFIEDETAKLPTFLEKDFSDVTFFDYRESKLMSFVENEQIPSFIEENQEEEQWIENDSG
jgi:hypothetical protein